MTNQGRNEQHRTANEILDCRTPKQELKAKMDADAARRIEINTVSSVKYTHNATTGEMVEVTRKRLGVYRRFIGNTKKSPAARAFFEEQKKAGNLIPE